MTGATVGTAAGTTVLQALDAQSRIMDEVRSVLGPLVVGLLALIAAPSTAPYASLDRDGRLLHIAATISAVAAVGLCTATIAVGSLRTAVRLELLAFDATALAGAFGTAALVGARFDGATGAVAGLACIVAAAFAEVTTMPDTAPDGR